MKILYVTSEANPYAASGGLGDVMGALPIEVTKENPQVSAEVILPLYDTMKEMHKNQLTWVTDIEFNLAWRKTGASIYKIENDGVIYYFIENHYYFDRGRLYGEFDDAERFSFFSRAVIEYILQSGNIPDVLHANDWQCATSIILLKTEYSDVPQLSGIKTLYTIHNIEYQGKFDPYILGDIFGISDKYLDVVEYDNALNLMKGAITVSDYVSTVSPNYANELRYDFFSFGLSNIISASSDKMCGVINGIDYNYFSPEKGGDIYKSYTTRTLISGKRANKLALQEELGLEVNEKVPLVVMITRLTAGKGIDLVLHILDELLLSDIQVAILGTGDTEYEEALAKIAEKHKNFKALIKFDRALSKKMYAGADMFLMPSKSEPCGLAQMIACSYGTVPIVRSVGGLYDSIIPYGEENANGFRFDNYNAHELLYTIKSALLVYQNAEKWKTLRRSAKTSDFSWSNSAKKYISIYTNLIQQDEQ